MVETTGVNVTADNVVYTFAPHAFAGAWRAGLVAVRIAQPIPDDTTGTLPVLFSTNGVNNPVTNVGGVSVTAEDITGAGVYLFFFDKATNTLQVLTGVNV